MDYKALLEHSYKVAADTFDCAPESRLEYLGDHIFGFTTYDGEMSVLFARKAVEVCTAVNNRLTFDYIENPDDYRWYLLMCNMPFFSKRLEWGTSIRGAWWGSVPGKQIEFQSCGLWLGDKQLHQAMKFSREEWEKFIASVIEFAADEMKHNVEVTGAARLYRAASVWTAGLADLLLKYSCRRRTSTLGIRIEQGEFAFTIFVRVGMVTHCFTSWAKSSFNVVGNICTALLWRGTRCQESN